MNLKFNKLILKNFGSYGTEEIYLNDKGYCLVTGENHCINDNALSNGAGKSFLWSGICYALTGETIQGISNNLKNINIPDDPACEVSLDFNVDKDNYVITRIHKPKSDLKIILNDKDISGKGIKESEAVLKSYLPDITKNLIASTILIGQGMPNKFSSFSPAGRKELLEKLTKSDFMIEDIKTRIATRLETLSTQKRSCEDTILTTSTQLGTKLDQLNNIKSELSSLVKPDFDAEIINITNALAELDTLSTNVKNEQLQVTASMTTINTEIMTLANKRSDEIKDLDNAYKNSTEADLQRKTDLNVNINTLAAEIKKLNNITDICPTCGQKLPGVLKPDTSAQQSTLLEYKTQLSELESELKKKEQQYKIYLDNIYNTYGEASKAKTAEYNELTAKNKELINKITELSTKITSQQSTLLKVQFDKSNFDTHKTGLEIKETTLTSEATSMQAIIDATNLLLAEVDDKLAVVKKMETLAKRDFRGFLLLDIIKYLNTKAKEYCSIVFKNTLLDLTVNGNALEITYCGKPLENLSGGERQKVDLILQFSIRDLMTTYFNYSSNILVLDEVTDFLDSQSCDAVMSLISSKLQGIESIFIISHHAESLPIIVDSEIKIYKNEAGISTIISQ